MYNEKKILAIIPARSESKGLPDKNIKEINGKPLVAYTIEAAIQSSCFDKVLVSTDSEKYAEISRRFGAEVPFLRSKENSSSGSGSWSVCEEVLKKLDEDFDLVVLLQPTSPLRTASDIQGALDFFFLKNADSVVSVTRLSHPREWCNILPESLTLCDFLKAESRNKRRQDLPQSYTLNGAIYIVKAKMVNSILDLYCQNSYAYVMDESHSIDVDSEFDFKMAQLLLSCSK